MKVIEEINFSYNRNNKEDYPVEYASIIIIYSDINGNTYMTMINISLEIDQGNVINQAYYEYYEESQGFQHMIKKRGISASKIKKEYLKKVWNSEVRIN